LDGEGVGDGGDELTNIQYKAIQNCHNKSPLYNEYVLIKMEKKKTKMFKSEKKKKKKK
jgi:hypothetical protein